MTDRKHAPSPRVARRKAQTRQKLIGAARALLAEDAATTASVQEITERADVGFGSFYNHFAGKTELFDAAVTDALAEIGKALDTLSERIDDPARAFAQSVRITARLGISGTEQARILVRHGLEHLGADDGLGPRAARDIRDGVAAGRFRVTDVPLAVAASGGALLAMLHLCRREPGDAAPDDAEQRCDVLAEQLLCMLGVDPGEAAGIAREPLPRTGRPTWD